MEKDYAENLDLMDKVDSEKVQIFLNVQPEDGKTGKEAFDDLTQALGIENSYKK